MTLKPGIHLGISDEVYHADPCERPSLSSGIMQRLLTMSPLHAYWNHPKLNPEYTPSVPEDVTERGQLAHAMLLGGTSTVVVVNPAEFPAEKTGNIPDGWTNKAIRAERDRIRAAGKIPVFPAVYGEALEMALAARSALEDCEIPVKLEDCDTEVVVIWEDGGITCRAKADIWTKDRMLMIDYKSTAGLAHPDFWIRRQMGPLGYGLQSSHYRRGGRVVVGERPEWLFLVQENFPPFACSIIGVAESMDEILEQQRLLAYALWRKHLGLGSWPGYGNRIAHATPSSWEMESHERNLDRMIELGGQG